MLLDFQACTNAVWDGKHLCRTGYQTMRRQLEDAGLGSCLEKYLSRLRELESARPSPGGDRRRFDEVRSYREAVARLSLATAIAMDGRRIDEEIRATRSDVDAEALFRIVMQCQIIDDVVDYSEDVSAGLPSFLTACASLSEALELTAAATRDYGSCANSSERTVLPLRIAVTFSSAAATLILRASTWRQRRVALCASLAAVRAGRQGDGLEVIKGKPDG